MCCALEEKQPWNKWIAGMDRAGLVGLFKLLFKRDRKSSPLYLPTNIYPRFRQREENLFVYAGVLKRLKN